MGGMENHIKCTLIGDRNVGKTYLCRAYKQILSCHEELLETDFLHDEHPCKRVAVDGHDYCIGLWDTHGDESYDELRPFSYPGTDVFLMCFSLLDVTSYENVLQKWYPTVQHHCPGVPVVVIGTKLELPESQDVADNEKEKSSNFISESQGRDLARKVQAVTYIECCLDSNDSVRNVMDVILKAAVASRSKEGSAKHKKCNVM